MSELAKTARKDAKEKIDRMLMSDPHAKVDASSWTPSEALDADVQTGPRPVSRQAFKHGGGVKGVRVIDGIQVRRGDRKPRANGGNAMATPNNLQNRDLKEANELRNGTKHDGGFKKGGSVHADAAEDKKLIRSEMEKHGAKCKCAKCNGGRAERATGGTSLDGEIQGTRPTGGRLARKDGGKTGKGKMNVNIIIAAGKGDQSMPGAPMPMQPPPGGPVGLRQGVPPPPPMMPPGAPPGGPMPMPRRSGGRTGHYDAGAGSGLGRLEKIKNYGGA